MQQCEGCVRSHQRLCVCLLFFVVRAALFAAIVRGGASYINQTINSALRCLKSAFFACSTKRAIHFLRGEYLFKLFRRHHWHGRHSGINTCYFSKNSAGRARPPVLYGMQIPRRESIHWPFFLHTSACSAGHSCFCVFLPRPLSG